MLSLPPSVRVFVATQLVDGRKRADSLMMIVRDALGHDPLRGTSSSSFRGDATACAIPSLAQGAGAPARPKVDKRKLPRDRKGRHPGRAMLPAHLERIPVPTPVPLEMRCCPRCGTEMTTVDHAPCEILSVIPARVVVNVRLDERVACPNDHSIVTAPTPPAIVERGELADPLIVEATCDKYLEHAPIERQCVRFARQGVEIAPQTLGRSVAAHLDLLAPLARQIEDQTRAPGLLATDATGIPILDPDAADGIRVA